MAKGGGWGKRTLEANVAVRKLESKWKHLQKCGCIFPHLLGFPPVLMMRRDTTGPKKMEDVFVSSAFAILLNTCKELEIADR